jgi:dihydrofolate reductase
MKLTTTAQVSADGVMQGPGGPAEDERGVFERGGWAHFDNEAGAVMAEIFQRADAFLFGRRTYEIFAGSWGTWPDPGDSLIWKALNTLPKYVASATLTEPAWANTTVLSGNVAAAVAELKAKPGGELQVHGSGALFRWLLDNDLVGPIAGHPERCDDPGLPAHRAPAVCNRHRRPEAREIGAAVSESRSWMCAGCSVDSWRLVTERGASAAVVVVRRPVAPYPPSQYCVDLWAAGCPCDNRNSRGYLHESHYGPSR